MSSDDNDLDPEAIKAKLADFDAQLARKLGELGFTRDGVARQMDRSIPEAVRKAEAERVLRGKLVEDLNNPRSGALDLLIDRIAHDMENQLPEIEREVRETQARRRRTQIVAAGAALAVVGAAVWWFVLRDGSLCTRLSEPIEELGELAGVPLRPGYSFESDHFCSYTGKSVEPPHDAITVDIDYLFPNAPVLAERERGKYTRVESIAFGDRTAQLYVAAVVEGGPSPDELLARAQARVGRSRDPVGDVLSELPPSAHQLVFALAGYMVVVRLDNKHVTVDEAKAVAAVLARRAAGLP